MKNRRPHPHTYHSYHTVFHLSESSKNAGLVHLVHSQTLRAYLRHSWCWVFCSLLKVLSRHSLEAAEFELGAEWLQGPCSFHGPMCGVMQKHLSLCMASSSRAQPLGRPQWLSSHWALDETSSSPQALCRIVGAGRQAEAAATGWCFREPVPEACVTTHLREG